jgi:hypothetical protein
VHGPSRAAQAGLVHTGLSAPVLHRFEQQSELSVQLPDDAQFVVGPPQVPPAGGQVESQQSAEVEQGAPASVSDHEPPHVVAETQTAGDTALLHVPPSQQLLSTPSTRQVAPVPAQVRVPPLLVSQTIKSLAPLS